MEAGIFLFEFLHDSQALAVMLETAMIAHQFVQHPSSFVAEGRMAKVVRQSDGFGQVFVEVERAGNVAGRGGDLDGMGQPCAEVVAGAVEEDLGLVLQAPKGPGIDHPVTIALILRSP